MRQNLVRNIQQRDDGQTLLMFVLFMIVLFLFAGLGIDLGFAYITRARLSKAVDAAALTGLGNIGQGTLQASVVASNAFQVNYGSSGRDVSAPKPKIVFTTDSNNRTILDVNASVTIRTFFIRVLPQWSTLTVGSTAEAVRNTLIVSLVLDRSGSMVGDGGAANLPTAVSNFIGLFSDKTDRASMSSFSYAPSVDVAMEQPFQADIKKAANNLNFNGWTCSERGLTNGLAQNDTIPAGPNVIRVIVFFTDGLANTWYWQGFDCGPQDIAPDSSLYDPVTGNPPPSGSCHVPATIAGLSGTVTTSDQCGDMYAEAQARAEAVAKLARSRGNAIYSIGFGDPINGPKECNHPPLNEAFLKNLANTPDSLTHDGTQPEGDFAIATDARK